MDTTFEDFLEHHGIPGMKWGIRRGRGVGGTLKTATTKQVSEDAHAFKELTTKARTHGLHSLSNHELKKLNERFDMEKKYSKLEQEMKSKKNGPMMKLVKKVIANSIDTAVSSLASHIVDAHVTKFKAGKTVARMLPKAAKP